MSLDAPGWLWLLPLALLPLWARRGVALPNAWVTLVPHDAASDLLQWALRGAAVLALAALMLGLAGPYRPEYPVERVGRGAEIVLVLDRSRSMDQGFAGGRNAQAEALLGRGPEALDYYARLRANEARQSKGMVARQLLSEFAGKRPEDRFGMVVFSTLPMRVLDFTQKSDAIQAAIGAGNIGRGLSETNIGLAMLAGLSFFEDRPYTGSRIIMLVSDGGDHIDGDVRDRIAHLARKDRVGVYWLYIRSARSAGLGPAAADGPLTAGGDAAPEVALHHFFESLGTPYRAYEAENPQALQKAIEDVDRLENLPINYLDTVPRRDLSAWAFGLALACVLLTLGANLTEIRRWR
ncbi:vWA domain-containing protein [Ideonella sp.]|uniref:vWA domain-containing protein n=1 Tax=Ideonella sp. TaxID=1929293 RepID=UPI002B4A6798|nr:vWA domain-containing protein [Ideonella sp.]HJV72079.1 vWA domain-containing protein [Ideonella sp.]